MLAFPQPDSTQNLSEEALVTSGLTLAVVLDHEEILSDVKQSAELREFLGTHLTELVQTITNVCEEDTEHGRKRVFVACELLRQDEVLDLFLLHTEAIRPLFELLQSDPPLDITQVGYSCQVAQSLVMKHHGIVMDLLQENSEYISALKKHVGTRSVAEVYLTLLADNLGSGDEALKGRLALFKSLVFSIEASRSPQELVNMGYIALEVIRRNTEIHGWKLIASVLLCKETLEQFERVLSGPPSLALEKVAEVLSQLLESSDLETLLDSLEMTLYAVRSDSFEELPAIRSKSFEELPEMCSPANCQSKALTGLSRVVKAAVTALRMQPELPSIPTAFGKSQPALGGTRLSLIRLLNSALKLDDETLLRTVSETDYVVQVTQLFVEYPWHSALHHAFENLVRIVIDGPSSELKETLFVKARLIGALIELARSGCTSPRIGSLGHVTRIANAIVKIASVSTRIRQYTESPEWADFLRDYVAPQNAKEEASSVLSGPLVTVFSLQLNDEMESETEFTVQPPQQDSLLAPAAISSDPEVEFEQGSDVFNSYQFWKQHIVLEQVGELE